MRTGVSSRPRHGHGQSMAFGSFDMGGTDFTAGARVHVCLCVHVSVCVYVCVRILCACLHVRVRVLFPVYACALMHVSL
jgi:hypothetical protein